MTLPTLIGSYKRKQAEAQLKKAYSVINQAFISAQSKYGEENNWPEWNDAEVILKNYIAPEINGAKVYPKTTIVTSAMCHDKNDYKSKYYWMNGVGISSPFSDETASIRLTDGVCIGLNPSKRWESKMVFIDTNGNKKGPNKAGIDLFFFYIDSQGFVKPYGDNWKLEDLGNENKQFSCNAKAPGGGYVCAARIMAEGWEINYWNN